MALLFLATTAGLCIACVDREEGPVEGCCRPHGEVVWMGEGVGGSAS